MQTKNLRLPLERKWFELTKAGIKKEDYRVITPYWCNRFLLFKGGCLSKEQWRLFLITNGVDYFISCLYKKITFNNFDFNIMPLGYPKSTDTERITKLEHKGIEVDTGNPKWGAEPNKLYFVIKHGEIIK